MTKGLSHSQSSPGSGCLDKESIRALLGGMPPLVEGYIDLEAQLQPNGIDLTVREVASYLTPGILGKTNQERVLSDVKPLPWGGNGLLCLQPGPYLVTVNERVNLPLYLMALSKPRSSLLRCGVAVHNAVWDAGYSGRGQALMVVYNPHGFSIARDARIAQMVFFPLARASKGGYKGRFFEGKI